MENNFYVGCVYHGKRIFKSEYKENLILYSEDRINYIDLLSGIWYTTDKSDRDYVEEESVVPTDISNYRENYSYLLSRYKENGVVRKKVILFDK